MKKILKKAPRFIVAALLIAAVLAFGSTAFASIYPKEMTATTPLNVRSGPGTQYSIIGELYTGQKVTVTGATGRWGTISYGNTIGYVHLSYLRDVSTYSTGAVSGNTMYVSTGTTVYSGPGANYSVTGTLYAGSTVTRTGTTGSWTQISWNGGYGYVYSAYLSYGSSYINTTPAAATSASGTYYANRTANIRSGPGTGYSILSVIYPNETVTRTGVIGNWTQISYNNSVAYVYSAYLSPYYTTTTYTPAVPSYSSYYSPYYYGYPYSSQSYYGDCYALATTSIYQDQATSATVAGIVIANQRVTRVAYYGTWSYITFYEFASSTTKTGYIPSMYLRTAY